MEEFNVNAHQYCDFTKITEDDQNVDAFFDQLSIQEPVQAGPKSLTERLNLKVDNDENAVIYSPMQTVAGTGAIARSSKMRRSSSVGDLKLPEVTTNEYRTRLELVNLKLTKYGSSNSLNKPCTSRERLDRLAQPKGTATQSNFVSMAESVLKFQKSTPKRFRRVENSTSSEPHETNHTRPCTPKLLTKNRTRPVYALSREEQEKAEMDEAKKFKIRAQPLNARVLQPPKKPVLIKKSPTVPQPFNLTEMASKLPEKVSPETFNFHAKPIPKTLHSPFKVHLSSTAVTHPSTSQCLRRYAPNNGKIAPKPPPQLERKEDLPLKRTQPIPFSFEKRDEELKKKKEELIRKTFEEEKKAREFHANPVPKCLKHSKSSESVQSTSSNKSQGEPTQPITFKARPANVLKMKPFEPVKVLHTIDIEEFNLVVENRLKERHEFDLKMQERERQIEEKKLIDEQKRLEIEEQQKMELRKQAEIKAQPIRKYKPIEIKHCNKVTEPVSPKCHYKRKNKENVASN